VLRLHMPASAVLQCDDSGCRRAESAAPRYNASTTCSAWVDVQRHG
jgi:hypothetical protein